VALALAAVDTAQAVSLRALLAGQSITAGDTLFDDWQLISQDTSDGHTIDTDNILVTALTAEPYRGPGLQFNLRNYEFAVTGDDIYAYIDFQFAFRVSLLDPRYKVKDIRLAGLGSRMSRTTDGFNDLGAYILESIGTAPGLDDLGVLDAEHSVLDDVLFVDGGGTVEFTPQSELWVTKNLLVWAQDATDTAILGTFNQRFSRAIPEPPTWLLMALGLVGLMGLGRKVAVRA